MAGLCRNFVRSGWLLCAYEQVNKNVYFAKKQISCFNCNEVIPEGMLIAENKKYLDNLEINDSVLALLDSANEKQSCIDKSVKKRKKKRLH